MSSKVTSGLLLVFTGMEGCQVILSSESYGGSRNMIMDKLDFFKLNEKFISCHIPKINIMDFSD
jgi:hypothetical protein